jgi:hypothetical protein
MSDTTTAPPAKAFLRFIDDALTFEGQVWRAGAVCETNDMATALLEPAEQRKRWGTVHFELISEEEYLALRDIPAQNLRTVRRATMTPPPPATGYDANGEERTYDPGKASPVAAEAAHTLAPLQLGKMLPDDQQTLPPEAQEYLPGIANVAPPAPADPWAWYDGATDMETVQQVARLGESQLQEFLAYERANKNRPAVIKLIETGEL